MTVTAPSMTHDHAILQGVVQIPNTTFSVHTYPALQVLAQGSINKTTRAIASRLYYFGLFVVVSESGVTPFRITRQT